MSLTRSRIRISRAISIVDVFLLIGLACLVYLIIGVAQEWAGPYRPKTEIDLSFVSLARYSFFSLVRVLSAYAFSVGFTLVYGYWAAKSRFAEPVLIPLLDILQSVPVLGFMPGLVLALVNVFPNSNLGLELAAIFMIFTGQGWNMVFSFYTSIKTVPTELRDMSQIFGLRTMEVLRKIEIPFAMTGLLWNSMLSMAGGWFFLMVIESFTLGEQDFRLPGIGSYMAVAYEQRDLTAISAGIVVMFSLILIMDRCIWAPLVVWSQRFRMEKQASDAGESFVLDWLKRSRVLSLVDEWASERKRRLLDRPVRQISQVETRVSQWVPTRQILKALRFAVVALGLWGFVYASVSMGKLVSETPLTVWLLFARDTSFTFLRVFAAVFLGSLWTIPVGVWIGTNPRWTRRMQPVVQVVASFPAPMLFPMITYALMVSGVGLEIGSVILMIFASQWYILFNVISGATLIPRSLLDVAEVYQVRGWKFWRALALPAIFPSLVNGWITAAGGAWNACIVSEIVEYGDGQVAATGIGSAITQAAQAGNFPALAAAILMMVTTVVLLNRFLWGTLYRLAEQRFRLEINP
jgi:NitT/TauT family transport system permease protein